MRQTTFAGMGFERFGKTTRRAAFLAEMDQVVSSKELCHLIESVYRKPGNGRPPVGLERMLRIDFLQQWFNPSDPGWKRRFTSRYRCAGSPGLTLAARYSHQSTSTFPRAVW